MEDGQNKKDAGQLRHKCGADNTESDRTSDELE